MTLKNKISFLTSAIFTLLYLIASIIIYLAFSDFRKDEFETRLRDKAVSTIKLLIEVKEIDNHLLKIIDQNSINKLYNEKTLVFDANYKLIYSSLDDTKINWTVEELKYLKEHKSFFRNDGTYEVYGFFYDTYNQDYFAMVSATDDLGKRKLAYLFYILIATYFVFTAFCWIMTSYAVKKLLTPLNVFHSKIKNINENNLETRIEVKKQKDEIDLLANEFNEMLKRIDNSYQKQKEFTSHASHELRTPVARVTSQLENKIMTIEKTDENHSFLQRILSDINQISELISSLLLLSKTENKTVSKVPVRVDEIFYESIGKTIKNYPEFKINFEIEDAPDLDNLLEIKGNGALLEIAFTNLLKNACLYSTNAQANVAIKTSTKGLIVRIENDGPVLTSEEQQKLFEPFMRGNNSRKRSGMGLGLRIVQRILNQHNASIRYLISPEEANVFEICLNN